MQLFEVCGGGFVCAPQFQGIINSKGLWFCQKLLQRVGDLGLCNDLFNQAVFFLFGAEITLLGEKLAPADKVVQRLTEILTVVTKLQSANPEIIRGFHLVQETIHYIRGLLLLFLR